MTQEQQERWRLVKLPDGWWNYENDYEEIAFCQYEGTPQQRERALAYLNALEAELVTLRTKAELADEIAALLVRYRDGDMPLMDIDRPIAEMTGLLPSAREWLTRYDALTQPTGETPRLTCYYCKQPGTKANPIMKDEVNRLVHSRICQPAGEGGQANA